MASTEKPRPQMTEDELRALPVAVPLVDAGRALCMGRTKAQELARTGKFPCLVLRCGPAYVVPKPALLEVLGYPIPEIPLNPATP
ncbi:DNA-binding protein [Nonomuraea sp. SBT364]|uniref:DNA-binding protein n=1 Tax=Nonomuraea sp. SBT364 TaxID=1580530 RepID=UPI000AD3D74F|nr:DNA-binding protein [Nonomuraea sp. SBT364]